MIPCCCWRPGWTDAGCQRDGLRSPEGPLSLIGWAYVVALRSAPRPGAASPAERPGSTKEVPDEVEPVRRIISCVSV